MDKLVKNIKELKKKKTERCNLKIGKTYILGSVDGDIVCKLVSIESYQYLSSDYIFDHIAGDDTLARESKLPGKLFPIPIPLMGKIKVKEA